MMLDHNQPEDRLSASLRQLAASSRRGASPELGLILKDSFRRHHARRRRIFRMRITSLALFVVGLGLVFLLRHPSNNRADRPAVVRTIPPEEVAPPAQISVVGRSRPVVPKRTVPPSNPSAPANTFLTLPSFVMVPAGDELRVIRLEMPGEDLRLVGAHVSEEIAGRRVTADFVVGHDGTPYAMRLVNFKENHP